MKLTEELKQQICDLIEESLNNAKLQGLQVEDEGGGFPLVDYLSYEGKTILKGKEEITNIVEQIYFDMDSWDVELQQYAVSKSEALVREVALKAFAKEMQNICVMDDKLPSDEYVNIWIESL